MRTVEFRPNNDNDFREKTTIYDRVGEPIHKQIGISVSSVYQEDKVSFNDERKGYVYEDSDNNRKQIVLPKPIINTILCGTSLNYLKMFLITKTWERNILDGSQVYSINKGQAVPIESIMNIEDIMLCGDYIKKLIDEYEPETRILKYLESSITKSKSGKHFNGRVFKTTDKRLKILLGDVVFYPNETDHKYIKGDITIGEISKEFANNMQSGHIVLDCNWKSKADMVKKYIEQNYMIDNFEFQDNQFDCLTNNRVGKKLPLLNSYVYEIAENDSVEDISKICTIILKEVYPGVNKPGTSTYDTKLSLFCTVEKEQLKNFIIDRIIVLPDAFIPRIGNKPDPLGKAYQNVSLACKKLDTQLISKDKSISGLIAAYNDLQEKVKQLLDKPDEKDAKALTVKLKLQGKTASVRSIAESRRVDYSARSAIVVNPELSVDECGLPKSIISKLFAFHIIKHFGYSIWEQVSELPEADDYFCQMLIEAKMIKEKPEPLTNDNNESRTSKNTLIPVQLNRAPTLHKLGFLAYDVVCVDSKAIQVNPLVCEGFNADFDGDQMAVHMALLDRTNEEVKNLMKSIKNIFHPAHGKVVLKPRQDMLYGLFQCYKTEYEIKGNTHIRLNSLQECAENVMNWVIDVDDTVIIGNRKNLAGVFCLYWALTEEVVNSVANDYKETQEQEKLINQSIIEKNAKVVNISLSIFEDILQNKSDNMFAEISSVSNIEDNDVIKKVIVESISAFNKVKEANQSISKISDIGILPVTKETIISYMDKVLERKTSDGNYNERLFMRACDRLVKLGFRLANRYAKSISIFNIESVKNKLKEPWKDFHKNMEEFQKFHDIGCDDEYSYSRAFETEYKKTNNEIAKIVREKDILGKNNGFVSLIECGARGDYSNLVQMYASKGRIAKSDVESFNAIIETAFIDGLNGFESYIGAYGTRKGIIEKSRKPADTGYASRKMWHTTCNAIITCDDCNTRNGILIKEDDILRFTKDSGDRFYNIAEEIILNRYAFVPKFILTGEINKYDTETRNMYLEYEMPVNDEEYVEIFCDSNVSKILSQKMRNIRIRSPLTCEKPYCSHCYGADLSIRGKATRGTPIGYIAAEAIGEVATQLTMKSFQTGGVAGKGGIASAFDRVNLYINIINLRNKEDYSAYDPLAWSTGEVKITPDSNNKDIRVSIGKSKSSIKLPATVKLKSYVTKGEGLCRIAGDYYIKEIESYKSLREAQLYLMYFLYFIYKKQANVNIKHIELLIAEMTMCKVISTNVDGLQEGFFYTLREIISKDSDRKNTLYIPTLISIGDIPRYRQQASPTFNMEDVGAGLARVALLKLNDNLDESATSAIMWSQPPNLGTYYNKDYIKERNENMCNITALKVEGNRLIKER